MIDDDYCRALSRRFYIAGHDREDVEQIARIAMWRAPAGVEKLAARRAVIDTLRTARRDKRPVFRALLDVHADPVDLVELVEARERLRQILAAPYSPLERVAVGRALRGEGCPRAGGLDNALIRARQKLGA